MNISVPKTQDKEIWKDIPGYEGYYQASTWGRIKPYFRIIRHRQGGSCTIEEIPILGTLGNGGYYMKILCVNGKKEARAVHYWILLTFVGPRPKGKWIEARHKDGNKLNNRLENLCWGTQQQQAEDKIIHGKDTRGEKHGNHKLTAGEVLEIRKLYTAGKYLQKELSQKFGVTQSAISNIIHKRNWKHID